MIKKGQIWYTDFTLNGKRIRQSTGIKDKKKALEWEKNYIQGLRSNLSATQLFEQIKMSLVDKSVNFWDAFKMFEDYPRKASQSVAQNNVHQSCWNDFSEFCKATYELEYVSMVEEKHVFGYIKQLKEKGRFSKIVYTRGKKKITNDTRVVQLSPRTINNYIAMNNLIFSVLKKLKAVIENPFQNVELLKKTQSDRDIFTPDEIKLLTEKAIDSYLYPIIIVGVCTGLRKGDICNLRWADISNGWINLAMRKTKHVINIPIIPVLQSYFDTLQRDNIYLFPQLQKQYSVDDAKISKDFKSLLCRCDITNQTQVENRSRTASLKDIHSLRHTFAYFAGINRIPFPIVQSVLGHLSPKMTELYMRHANREDKRQAIDQMVLPFDMTSVPCISSVILRDKHEQFRRILTKINPQQFARFRHILLIYA